MHRALKDMRVSACLSHWRIVEHVLYRIVHFGARCDLRTKQNRVSNAVSASLLSLCACLQLALDAFKHHLLESMRASDYDIRLHEM